MSYFDPHAAVPRPRFLTAIETEPGAAAGREASVLDRLVGSGPALRATARAAEREEARRRLAELAAALRIVAEADHALTIDVHTDEGVLALEGVLFRRMADCARPRLEDDGRGSAAIGAERVSAEALCLDLLDLTRPWMRDLERPAPARIPLPVARAEVGRALEAGGAGADEPLWLCCLADRPSLRLVKTDFLGGRGAATVAYVHADRGPWCRARLVLPGPEHSEPVVEVAPIPFGDLVAELRGWILGRAPWAQGPFGAVEVRRIVDAQVEYNLRFKALSERKAELLRRFDRPLEGRRIEMDFETACREILQDRGRKLEALEPDAAGFEVRWKRTPAELRLADAAPGPAEATWRACVEESRRLLPEPLVGRTNRWLSGSGISRNYTRGTVFVYDGPSSIAAIAELGDPVTIVARRIPLDELHKLDGHLTRVRGFVIEDADLAADEQLFYAVSNRATVIGVADACRVLRDVASVFVDGVLGRVYVDMDPETQADYEARRRAGRPGTPAEDIARIMSRVRIPEMQALAGLPPIPRG